MPDPTYQPVYGLEGNPALHPDGIHPVCMLYPCPYAQWDEDLAARDEGANGSLSYGGGYIDLVSVLPGYQIMGAHLEFLMVAVKGKQLRCTADYSVANPGDISQMLVTAHARADPLLTWGYKEWVDPLSGATGTDSFTINQPYLRYRVKVDITMTALSFNSLAVGDRLSAVFSLV